jgi:hypothetical protein
MDVGGSAGIMTREKGQELTDTILVGLLNAAQESLVDVAQVGRIAVTLGIDTGVDASRVTVPHLKVDIRHRLTGINIDYLIVQDDFSSLLIFNDAISDVFARDV